MHYEDAQLTIAVHPHPSLVHSVHVIMVFQKDARRGVGRCGLRETMERETEREDVDVDGDRRKKTEREDVDVDGDSKQAEASGAVVGWVRAGRSGCKPALKVPFGLALFLCHLQPVVCSIHLLERRR